MSEFIEKDINFINELESFDESSVIKYIENNIRGFEVES